MVARSVWSRPTCSATVGESGQERSTGREEPRRLKLQHWVGPLAVVLVLHVMVLLSVLRSFDFNPTGPLFIGDAWAAERFWTESTLVQRGFGYDGQFFFYIAHDPLLRGDGPLTYLDHPAYRYGRPLYPLLSWATALGQPALLPWAMHAINLGMALLGTGAALAVVHWLGRSRWFALGYALNPGILLGLVAGLAEPTAFALVMVGWAFFLQQRHGGASTVLGLATLAREISFLIPLGFAIHQATRRAWREAAMYLAGLSVPVAWHLWVLMRVGALPSTQAPPNFELPFSGAWYRAEVLLGRRPPLMDVPVPEQPLGELLLVTATVGLVLYGLVLPLWRRDVVTLQFWLQAAAALCTSAYVWVGLGSYARVLGLLYLCFMLALLTAPRGAARSSANTRPTGSQA